MDYDNLFADIEEEIKTKRENIEKLNLLYQDIASHPETFDAEDCDYVYNTIQFNETEVVKLEKHLETHRDTVLSLKNALDTRQNMLENIDTETKVLCNNPDVMQYFVDKQAKLLQTLTTMQEKLSQQ